MLRGQSSFSLKRVLHNPLTFGQFQSSLVGTHLLADFFTADLPHCRSRTLGAEKIFPDHSPKGFNEREIKNSSDNEDGQGFHQGSIGQGTQQFPPLLSYKNKNITVR